MGKRLFVTVGSTKFPQLIRAVLSPEAIEVLLDLGFRELCVQYGTDTELFKQSQGRSELSITGFDYSQSIEREMQQADLIISHAGSGSVLEALHLGKLLIVVPNTSLMDNHQAEVAKALSDEGFLLETSPSELPRTLAKLKDKPQLRPFPAYGNQQFTQILDQELGLV